MDENCSGADRRRRSMVADCRRTDVNHQLKPQRAERPIFRVVVVPKRSHDLRRPAAAAAAAAAIFEPVFIRNSSSDLRPSTRLTFSNFRVRRFLLDFDQLCLIYWTWCPSFNAFYKNLPLFTFSSSSWFLSYACAFYCFFKDHSELIVTDFLRVSLVLAQGWSV